MIFDKYKVSAVLSLLVFLKCLPIRARTQCTHKKPEHVHRWLSPHRHAETLSVHFFPASPERKYLVLPTSRNILLRHETN